MQDLWCHTLQQSQHTPSFDQVTGISHIPHGNMLACLGPGFHSMSPDWIRMSSTMVVHCQTWMCCKCDSLNVSSFTYHSYEIENVSYYERLNTTESFLDSFTSQFSSLKTSSPTQIITSPKGKNLTAQTNQELNPKSTTQKKPANSNCKLQKY
jgi:hypothetical protein